MTSEIVYIVGNKYKEFSKNSSAMTVAEALKLTNIFQADRDKKIIYRIGQGVSTKDATQLNLAIQGQRLQKFFEIENLTAVVDEREKGDIVHKRKQENIMITTPTKVADNHFHGFLAMDEDCAESSDHVTGQHIQGMVLIEAARQMMLSVTENYFLFPHLKGKSYFTLNKVNTSFLKFTFPVDVAINYHIVDIVQKENGSIKSMAKILFEQLGEVVAEVIIEFSVYCQKFIENIEGKLATEVLEKAVKNASEIIIGSEESAPLIACMKTNRRLYGKKKFSRVCREARG